MNIRNLSLFSREMCRLSVLAAVLLVLTAAPAAVRAADAPATAPTVPPSAPPASSALPFHPGEKLTYVISWSNIVDAGTAVMEVRRATMDDGRDLLRFTSTARSTGILNVFYTVRDTIESLFDPTALQSISYRTDQRHGKRRKHSEILFDEEKGTATDIENGTSQTFDVPEHTQDALSSLYYLRTRKTFTVGKSHVISVHDGCKTWSVEIKTLGRERIKVPVGEFPAIKVKTYPKYEGVFMHKGEIYIWLSDDDRRIPLLMKSSISIGSIVATLTEMTTGEQAL